MNDKQATNVLKWVKYIVERADESNNQAVVIEAMKKIEKHKEVVLNAFEHATREEFRGIYKKLSEELELGLPIFHK